MPATATDRLQGLTTSVAVKAPCRVATTAAITLSGLQTIDGVTLAAGDRVLVKDQASATVNGIYNAAVGIWPRALDFNGSRDVVQGTRLAVTLGNVYESSYWKVATADPVIGATSLDFEQVSELPGPKGDAGATGPVGSGPPELASYGPVSTTAEVYATLTAAYAALAGTGIPLLIGADYSTGTTAPANPGVDFIGTGTLYYSPTGTGSGGFTAGDVLINLPGREPSLHTWGQEYIYDRFLTRLAGGSTTTIAVIGDSNAAGASGAALVTLLATLPNVTVVNYGVGGSTFGQWFNGTGSFATTDAAKKYSAVMATNPDLLIDLYGGTNDASYNGSPASFLSDKETGYAAIRAAKTIQQMSIVMATSGPMSDGGTTSASGGWHRDERANAKYRSSIRYLAKKYQALYTDKHSRIPDALIDFAAGAAQNTVYDPFRVHTQTMLSNVMAQWMFEDIIPSVYRPPVSNQPGSTLLKVSTDLPATYPFGVSINRAGSGFPNTANGFCFTFRPADTWGFQVFWELGDFSFFWYRMAASGTTWGTWRPNGTLPAANVVAGTGFVQPSTVPLSGIGNLQTVRHGNLVEMSGSLSQTTPATLSANQVLGNTSVSGGLSHAPALELRNVRLVLFTAASTIVPAAVINGRITTSGQISTVEAYAGGNVTTIYISETWSALRP